MCFQCALKSAYVRGTFEHIDEPCLTTSANVCNNVAVSVRIFKIGISETYPDKSLAVSVGRPL